MTDLPELCTNPSKGGAPANKLVRELTRRCYRVGLSPSEKVSYRCIASSVCRTVNSSRHADRVYKHATRCDALRRMNPDLHQRVVLARTTAQKMKQPHLHRRCLSELCNQRPLPRL